MKIENVGNNVQPLSSKPAESAMRVEKKEEHKDFQPVRADQDKAQMSENARLLAKARGALGSVEEINNDRIVTLKDQIANGSYAVQVNELARKLVARYFPK